MRAQVGLEGRGQMPPPRFQQAPARNALPATQEGEQRALPVRGRSFCNCQSGRNQRLQRSEGYQIVD